MEVFCNIDQDFYRTIGTSSFKIAEVAMENTKFFSKFSCDNFAFVHKVKIRLSLHPFINDEISRMFHTIFCQNDFHYAAFILPGL